MVLTPERIAELERLKKMYLPLAQEAQRQSQLSQNNERFVPVDKKASGGSMAPLTQLSATDPMLQGDVQPTSNAISLTPAEEKLAQQAALAATQIDLLQGGNSNATTSTATNGSPTGSVVGDIGYSLSAMAPFSVMGLVAQSMMDSMSPISPTSVNAVNGLDAQSDEATANGQAPTGSVNSGVSTAPSNDGVGVSNGSAGDATSGDSAAHGGSIHATKDMDTMRLALFKKGSRVSADTRHIKHTTKPSIFIGPEAATWDANHAFMAAKLEKQKHTPEEIWRKTGTFRSPSGGWKQEISDKASKFRTHADIAEMAAANAEKQGELKMGIERSLQREKEAKDLFPKHAVAARKETKAKLAKLKEEAGGYHGINASPNLTGNRLDIALEHPELYKAYPQLRETILKQGNNGLAGPLGSQQGKLINVNGRAFLEEPRSTALHEVQHAVQDIENWPRGGNVDMFTEQRLRERKKYMNILGTINGLLTHAAGTPEYEDLLKKQQDLVNIMQKQGLTNERDILKNAFRDYQHLGGEAEARAVQARRNMSDAERRENFPLNSYDVNPKQVINTNQYGEPMQMQMRLARGGIVGKLRKHGQGVPNELEAMKRMSQGHRVFVVHEQDEHPREVTSVRELAGYAPDQMYTLAPEHKADGGNINAMRLALMKNGSRVSADTRPIKFTQNPSIVPYDVAQNINMQTSLPTSPEFMSAVQNTPSAELTPEGLKMSLQRFQKPEQSGDTSVRQGVFYLPKGSTNTKHYKKSNTNYGGTEEITGDTLVRNPLFAKGATGGKAPEAAYDMLMGKGATKKLTNDIMKVIGVRNKGMQEEAMVKLLEQYGLNADDAWHILQNSREGNQLRYALQERIIGHEARKAGHDAILGYSKGRGGKGEFLSELFDLRESDYPTKSGGYRLNPEFEKAHGGRITHAHHLEMEERPL